MNIIEELKKLKPILKNRFGIEEFAVFGSIARGEEKENSDIDIVILKMNIKSGLDIVKAQYFLESKFQRKVDIGLYRAMKTFIKKELKKS